MSTSCINLFPENNSSDDIATIANEDLAEIVNQSLTEAVFRCTVDGEILYLNNAFIELFEIKNAASVIGQKAATFYKSPEVLRTINTHLTSLKKSFKGEVEFRRQSGGHFFGHLSARLVRKSREKFIDGVIRDISSERKSKMEIEQQAAIQKLLIKISSSYLDADLDDIDSVIEDSLKEVGLFLNADRIQVHDYNFDNQKCLMSYEWACSEVPASDGDSHAFALNLIQDMVSIHEQGNHLFFPSVPSLPDSPVKEALMSQNIKSTLTIPMKLNGKCVGFISLDSILSFAMEYSESVVSMLKLFANMVANIATRARGHVRLKRLIEQVTLQSKQHKDFSFITSHNIRASVANMVAITDLMSQEYSEKYLEMLKITVNRLNDSINNINNILHLDHKDLLKRTSCNIGDSINRVLESLSMVIDNQDIEIIRDIPRSLYLNTLPSYLDNIFLQLITNAIRYGTHEECKKVMVQVKRSGSNIAISITDYGSGFDMLKYGKQVFKVGSRFHQNNCDGQGLGLYITKQQVESLDGTIEITSMQDAGTTVKLSFPLF